MILFVSSNKSHEKALQYIAFLLLLVPVFIMALFSIALNSDSQAVSVALTSLTK
jgi:hypothetical protein